MKTVAIIQSNYIPWKGYFDILHQVDEFILFDDMQYTRRDWRNRNMIKTVHGPKWLTIPVNVKGKYFQKIKDTVISDHSWADSHWRTLRQNYAGAPHFDTYADQIERLYANAMQETSLSRINYLFLTALAALLGITTKITWSMDYTVVEGKTERLVELCRSTGGTRYVSGPAARDYVDSQLFEQAGIELLWMDYRAYPEYPQSYPPFTHQVTILDLLFNTGHDAPSFIWGWRGDRTPYSSSGCHGQLA